MFYLYNCDPFVMLSSDFMSFSWSHPQVSSRILSGVIWKDVSTERSTYSSEPAWKRRIINENAQELTVYVIDISCIS